MLRKSPPYFVFSPSLQRFRQMQRFAAGGLQNLFPATETVGNDERILRRIAHRRQQHALAHAPGTTAYLSFSKPKGPAMPQQPESMDCRSAPVLRSTDSSVAHAHQRFVVAVPVQQHFPGKLRRHITRRVALQEFAEQKVWLRSFMARASCGNRLRNSSRNTEAQLGSSTTIGTPASICGAKSAHDGFEILLGFVQQTEIVQRPSAAEVHLRHGDAESGGLQNFIARHCLYPDENNC